MFSAFKSAIPVTSKTKKAPRPAPKPDHLWADVRRRRNALLTACDWTQLSDASLSPAKKTAWIFYRQALRDLTKQTDLMNLVWPKSPT